MSVAERREATGDSDDDDDAVPHIAQGTEATGRWSNEEHDLFIRGLELYGKGWKKIANLIKTRTVVQIRTHSQKYFQKLSKAKPGEMSLLNHHFAMPTCSSDPMSMSQSGTGNARKSKHSAKRDSMAKMAVAPSLKPYLTLPGVASVQAGLYKFLSPVMVDGKPVQELTSELVAHASAAAAATAEAAVAAAAAAETALEEKPTAVVEKPPAASATPVGPESGDGGAVSVPEWYAHGDGVKALLVQSESLDWAADSGGDALPIYNKAPKPKAVKAKTAAKAAKEAAVAETKASTPEVAQAAVETVQSKQQRGGGGKRSGGGERGGNKSRKTKGSSPPSVVVNFAPFESGLGSDMMSGSVDFAPQGGMSLSCSSLDMLGSLDETRRGAESGEDEDLMALDASGLDLIDHTEFDAAADDFL